MKIVLIGLVILAFAVAVLFLVLSGRFKAKIEERRKRLIAGQVPLPPEPDAIPGTVRAFAERNGGRRGGPAVLHLQQEAELRRVPGGPFMALKADQLLGSRDPGFVWEAMARMAGVVPLRAVDSAVGGTGWLEARIAGAVAVAKATGPDTDKGEMMRYLAELVWNPDAIINAPSLRWRQIDERTVEVAAETPGGVAVVRQLFDKAGDIVGIEADDRPYLVNGKATPTRWIGRFRDYASFGAYRLPTYGEIAWILPEGEYLYFRCRVTGFTPAQGEA